MSHQIKVPQVGESITEVTIGEWVKQDGDQVEMDEIICELESDKASFELNADLAGTLRIKAQTGDTLEIGAVICEIEEGEGSSSADSKPKAEKASSDKEERKSAPKEEKKEEKNSADESSSKEEKDGETLEMKVPAVGESITEVTVGTWEKSDGDHVEMDEVLCEIESDKATFELTAEGAGTLKILAQEGDVLSIGDPICTIVGGTGSAKPKSDDGEKSSSQEKSSKDASTGEKTYATGHASPAAKKILDEKGIAATNVKGTGVDGRITKEDAEKAEKSKAASPKATAPAQKSSQEEAAPATTGERHSERKRMSSLRKTVARRLVQVKNETAMLTTFNEVDMKPIMDLRTQYKEKFKEKHEVGLGFMSFFTKAVCVALQEWPAVNAQIDGDEMVFNDFCDISIAVSSPKGLVVPVIRNAEQLSFEGIEKEVVRLAKKARDGKLSIEEMQGGTFTLTNGGIFGSMMSTPIINAPQSAILGMHNIVERPVAINGQVEIRPMMYVAVSYDHRIIDGRESVSFLVRVKELLEDPIRLLLGV